MLQKILVIYCVFLLCDAVYLKKTGSGLQTVTFKCNIVYEDLYLTAVYLGQPMKDMSMQYLNKSEINATWHTFDKCTQESNSITSSFSCKTMNVEDTNMYSLQLVYQNGSTSNITGGFKPSTYRKQCVTGQPKVVLVKLDEVMSDSFIVTAKISQDAYFTTPQEANMVVTNTESLAQQKFPCMLDSKLIATCISANLLPSTKYKVCVTEKMKFFQTYTTCIYVITTNADLITPKPTPVSELPKSLQLEALTCTTKSAYIYLTVYYTYMGDVKYDEVKMNYQQSLSSWFPLGDGEVTPFLSCIPTTTPTISSITCKTKSIYDMNQYKLSISYEDKDALISVVVDNNFRPSTFANQCLKKAPALSLSASKLSSPSALTVEGKSSKPIPPNSLLATTYKDNTVVSNDYCSMVGPFSFSCTSEKVDACGNYEMCVKSVGIPGSTSCVKRKNPMNPGCVAVSNVNYDSSTTKSYVSYAVGFGAIFGVCAVAFGIFILKRRSTRYSAARKHHHSSYENLDTVGMYDTKRKKVTVSLLQR